MALTLQIKRSTGSVAPSSLQDGELAYTHGNEKLYIGDGSTVKLIGGKSYNDLIDHTAGTLTASSAVIVDSNNAISDFIVGNNGTTGGAIKFKEGTSNGTHHVQLKAPNALGANLELELPGTDGTNGQFLATNGSGTLSFASVPSGTFTLSADSGSDDSFSTGQVLTFSGGTGIDTTVSNNEITVDIDSTVATLTGTQTLTNKTLTAPVISSISNTGTLTLPTTTGTVALTSDIPTDNASLANGAGYITDVTGESVGDLSDVTITAAASGEFLRYNGTAWVDSTIQNGDISAAMVTQHEASLTITESQISDLQSYLTSVSQSDVTQHQAALSIATTQLTGTITNAQLAGSITNAKLVNSSVTIGSDTVSLGGTQTDLNGITSLDVDNITVDGNTVSTTDTDGDLALAPDGEGTVTVPSGYEGRTGFGADSLVNKTYVDNVANGLDVKESVRVATTADLSATYNNGAGTLTASSNGAISVDGVSLVLNDRVLVKDQTTQTENGIYKVTTVGSGSAAFVLTRTPDANDAAELTGGVFTFVEEGTANADNGYVATHNGTPTFGTTNITFDQFSGAGQISAGNGLTKTGNTIDVVGTSNRISVTANAVDISASYVGQTSITTLGTIATGTWNGTEVGVAYGGTGLTAAAKGSVLVANAADTISALDGGGVDDGFLLYNASTDTISWSTSIDGGTF
jgi:hypothetical protein